MTMLLTSVDGKEFELAVIRERIADEQDGSRDDVLVTLSMRVATGDAEWEESVPSLNMFELETLATWLESVGSGGASGDAHELGEVDLAELELNFQVVRNLGREVVVRVRFELEGLAEELAVGPGTDEARRLDLRLSRSALRVAARQLRADLEAVRREESEDLEGEEPGPMVRDSGVDVGGPENDDRDVEERL